MNAADLLMSAVSFPDTVQEILRGAGPFGNPDVRLTIQSGYVNDAWP
jgi:hypothetical protein